MSEPQEETAVVVLNHHGQMIARFPNEASVPDEVEDDYGDPVRVEPNNIRTVPVSQIRPDVTAWQVCPTCGVAARVDDMHECSAAPRAGDDELLQSVEARELIAVVRQDVNKGTASLMGRTLIALADSLAQLSVAPTPPGEAPSEMPEMPELYRLMIDQWRKELAADPDDMTCRLIVYLADALTKAQETRAADRRTFRYNADTIDQLDAERERLTAELAQVQRERDEARDFGSRWMKAALYATPITTMAFDPTNPEAFGESRRSVVDQMMADSERLTAELAQVQRERDEAREQLAAIRKEYAITPELYRATRPTPDQPREM